MPVEIVRGQVGRENSWNVGQESGFIAYIRGSIGDKPAFAEALLFGKSKALGDDYGLAEILLCGDAKNGDDVPSFSESATITNT